LRKRVPVQDPGVARERLGVEPVEIPGGHNPYAAAPGRVADLIVAAAERELMSRTGTTVG
jgi:hypothetical protein